MVNVSTAKCISMTDFKVYAVRTRLIRLRYATVFGRFNVMFELPLPIDHYFLQFNISNIQIKMVINI